MTMLTSLRRAYSRAMDEPQTLHPREAAAAGLDVRGSADQLEGRILQYGLWSGMVRHFWRHAVPYLLLGLGVIAAGPAMPQLIESVLATLDGSGSGDVIASAGILSAVVVAYVLLRWASTWQVRMLVYRIDLSMQRVIFRRLQHTDPRWLAEQDKSSTTLLLEYPQQLSQIAFVVEFIVYSAMFLVLIGVILLWYGLAGIAVLIVIAGGTVVSKLLIDHSTKATKTYLDADHIRAGLIETLVSAWQPIRRQHLEAIIAKSFDQVRTRQTGHLKRRALRSAWSNMVSYSLPLFAVWSAVAVGTFAGTTWAVGEGVALLVLVRLLLTALSENLATYATLRFGWSMGADVTQLLTEAPLLNDTDDQQLDTGAVSLSSGDDDTSTHIASGERVAVLGRNGGDTAAVLERIAGVPARQEDWTVRHRGDCVLVSRNQPTFDGRFADTVTLWSSPERPRYVQAQYDSGLLRDLAERPGGDSSPLSSTAQRVSDGQNVRISLAQALVTDPDILLLDDIFAPLDPQSAAHISDRVLAEGAGHPTRIFATTRLELARYSDTLLIVDGSNWLRVSREEVPQHRERISALLGAPLTTSLIAALSEATDIAGGDAEASDERSALHYAPGNDYIPPPHNAYEARVTPARPADLWRNVRGLFPAWAILLIPILTAVTVGAEYGLAGMVDHGIDTIGVLWLVAGVVGLSASFAWLRGFLVLRTPMAAINRIHTGLIASMFDGRNEDRHSAATGRISRDFFSLELRIPTQLSGFVAAWATVVIATATVVLAGWLTLLPLFALACGGIWSYRLGRRGLVSAVQLSAACRGPLLNFARDALSAKTFHASPALRAALSRRFDDLGSIRGVGMLRLSWVQLRTLLTVELLGVGLFLTTLWAVAAGGGASALAAGAIVYAAYTFSQQIAGLVENMQEMDSTLLMIGRVADSLGTTTLPSRAEARREIAPDTSTMIEVLLREQDTHDAVVVPLRAAELRLQMPEGIAGPAPLDLELNSGSFTVLHGPSGAGKSTLLRTVSGARRYGSGVVHLGDHVPDVLGQRTREQCRYVDSDLPALAVPVAELLAAASPHALPLLDGLTKAAASRGIDTTKPVAELDHASRQLVNLARGFADRPDLVLCDEATSAIDTVAERTLLRHLRAYAPDTAILAVLHRVDNQDIADTRLRIDIDDADGLRAPVGR